MTKNNKKGFTIIEVVLVLAIAGLIFLMVFIALPALQRSQRNTRRRQDMARILSAFNDFQANNNGEMPTGSTTDTNGVTKFMERYVGAAGSDQASDPDGSDYTLWLKGAPNADKTKYYTSQASSDTKLSPTTGATNTEEKAITHKIHYWKNAKCGDNEGEVNKGKGNREIAIFYYLEGGAIYCGDNQ